MAKIYKYAAVVASQTILGAASPNTVTSKKIPCRGAKMVVLVVSATNTVVPSAAPAIIGHQTSAAAGYFSPVNLTFNSNVNGAQLTNPASAYFIPTAGGYINWAWVSVVFSGNNTGGQDITGFTVDAYVYYEGDRDKMDADQDGAVAV
jgi:hypothetical protein